MKSILLNTLLIVNYNCFTLNFKSSWFNTAPSSSTTNTLPASASNLKLSQKTNYKVYNSTLDTSYGIILDAGSTGTRLFIYEWDPPKSCHYSPYVRGSKFKSGPREGKQIKIKKVGGLHNVNPSDVKEYLKEFLDFALDYVPKEQHHRTPIALLATAGMRIIPKARSSEIIDQVKLNLNSTGFYFDKTYGAIVIPGEYEGVFGWLATNYLSNNLNHHDKHFNHRHDDDDHRVSRAYFDMGGASTQITFEPNFMPYEHSFPINMNGTSRVVYTHSFLKFGRNEARKRYWNLISANSNGTTFEDPCLAGLLKHDALINDDVRTATGTGDFSECLKLTANLVNQQEECFYSQCTIYGIHLSPIPDDMELYFTANFFDTSNFFDLSGEQTLEKLLEKVPEICDLNKFQFLAKYNKKKFQRDKDFYFYCFNMAYYINLLTYGYHVAPDRKIVFTETVEDTDISWTLGAMIYEVHLLYPSGQCCDDWNDFRFEHPLVKKTNKKTRPMLI